MKLPHKYFISYKHDGGFYWAQLLNLCILYYGQGNEAFYDEKLYSRWSKSLEQGILNSVNVLVVFSKEFQYKIKKDVTEDIWLKEINLAIKAERNIIPIFVDGLTIEKVRAIPNLPDCIYKILDNQCLVIGNSDNNRLFSSQIWDRLNNIKVDEDSEGFSIPLNLAHPDDITVTLDGQPIGNRKTIYIPKGCNKMIKLTFTQTIQFGIYKREIPDNYLLYVDGNIEEKIIEKILIQEKEYKVFRIVNSNVVTNVLKPHWGMDTIDKVQTESLSILAKQKGYNSTEISYGTINTCVSNSYVSSPNKL